MWLLGAGALVLLIVAMTGGRGRRPASVPQPSSPPRPRIPVIDTVVPPPPPMPGQSADDAALAQAIANLRRVIPATDAEGLSWDALEADYNRAGSDLQRIYQNRDPSLVNGRPGSGATVEELESAIALARERGLTNIVFVLNKTLELKRGQSSAPITARDETFWSPATLSIDEPAEEARMQAEAQARPRVSSPRRPVAPGELPRARSNRAELRTLALQVVDNLNATGYRAYDRALMKRFQRAAGLAVDGDYGPTTKQAVGHYSGLPAGAIPPAEYGTGT